MSACANVRLNDNYPGEDITETAPRRFCDIRLVCVLRERDRKWQETVGCRPCEVLCVLVFICLSPREVISALT